MFSLPVVTWIGNAAAVLSEQWGAISQRARDVECRRQAMYHQARRVEQAVAEEQASGPSRGALLAEHQRLRDENRTVWALLEEAESLSRVLQHKFAATASAMGLSLTQLLTLLAIVVPPRCVPSRATVGRGGEQASSRAGRILQVRDRACQAWVLPLCLDAIFFHREPVLVAVDADSLAWVAGQRGPDRTGESWCRVLQQWPGLARVVSDAGTGLARGVKLLNEARAAWGNAERAFDAAVQVDAAVERIQAPLALVRPDGELNDRAWAQQQITDALGKLAGEAWSNVRRLLNDARTLHHLDWRHEQRAQAVPDPQ